MGVVLNDQVKSIAFIKSQIFDSGQISGRFTKQSADDLALTLRSGALLRNSSQSHRDLPKKNAHRENDSQWQ